ncbi:MAG: GspH/FimT family pseudopilin [Candidatus Thiodiazotropha endolucinida]|nr:GspH/FimT family pseudopilin [Candidatus Thiodiazotropha taylori]MCG8025802.1 GspH/FimT family pseudopilin [Candidatus Thiodiazotropha endolucinida]MCG8044625.1 GspH/FimT family pseudopilin [Candidatus Thiodiazotropha taylori]MCG8061173.1 GspH/FimT family pseudopilin [Candidatus Thiodiazotropha taylori]MCG8094753.1 GspH/FimT family pseudopilin [Candidatus Thiodiazotropha endolucinida]
MLGRFSRINHQGLTLLELLVAVVIAAILFGVGIPSFFNLIANNRLTVATNELVTSMHYARSEAVTREIPVSVCASEDGQSCSGSTDWGSGWIVFTDINGTNGMLDADDELLYSNLTDSDSIRIAAEYKYVRYSPRARAIQ